MKHNILPIDYSGRMSIQKAYRLIEPKAHNVRAAIYFSRGGEVFLFCFPFLKCKHVGFPFVFSFKAFNLTDN